ncbi:succinyl-diaminopimelate desuccinylase [Peribacillus deserti]|uniref:Succinyl-diaminopimelate desuccinylase n=1 Tax=Peribacillus deserti TaxID=673318 RepID=A0ABS2QI38_9BACI|nr:dipeptidase PepV [Peribacillus deserti]MBM7692803.1 succinyl-diaminopimelate desuccinylase [Peribacillus deserti]
MNWHGEILNRKSNLLDDLTTLLKIKSVKDLSTSSAQAPMGEAIGEALDYMLEKAKKDGFRTKNIEGYAGYAEMGPVDAEDYIAVLCHVDVVPASGDWTSDPFVPEIRDGLLYARGAIDDKGPTMAAYYAFKLVKDLGLPLKHRVRIIFGTDEESGMSCMQKYMELEPHPIAGFAPDADFPIIYAEKGQINIRLKFNGEIGTVPAKLVSFKAGERANVVPDLAVASVSGDNLDVMKTDFEAFCRNHNLEGGSLEKQGILTLSLKGKPAHAMEPEKGLNAGTKLAAFLVTQDLQPIEHNYLQFLAELDEDHYGNNLSISFSDEITGPLTVNPGIITYDLKEANVHLNLRCPVKTSYHNLYQQLEAAAGKYGFITDELRERLPHHVDAAHPLIKTLQKIYQEETSSEPVLLTTGGNTYARTINNGVAFGALFPGRPDTAHQKDESISVDDLIKAASIYARAIYELANTHF